MGTIKTKISDIHKKYLKIVAYLTLSNGLGYILATYVAKDPALTMIFGPVINFLAWTCEKELKAEGYIETLRSR